ncbi:hypothetical protein LDI01_26360 [Lentilactobacillus diolivorans]|nr:hypothetical protein LDI01_26360 [Lentilactobacillus diolivorans]
MYSEHVLCYSSAKTALPSSSKKINVLLTPVSILSEGFNNFVYTLLNSCKIVATDF